MMKKLRSPRGETLVETLAAMVLITMASILFLQLSGAAAGMSAGASQKDKTYQSDLSAAERRANPVSGAVQIGGETGTVDVSVCRNTDSALAAYELDESSENNQSHQPQAGFDLAEVLRGEAGS